MSKRKNILIPDLRFPEFVNEGGWVEKTLEECLLKSPDYGINAPAVPYSENLPTYLRITDISEDGHFQKYEKVSVDRGVTENNYLVEDDIVLARTGASVGKSYKYRKKDGRLVFAGFLIRVRPNIKKLNSELLFQFLSTRQYWKWVSFISARSGQPGINGTEYSSMPISLPPIIEEQKKIASCLSSLDELITANNQKLELLKEHKKGLMQNLFPQEGETTPKWRFKEFVKDGEWVEKTLDSLSTKIGDGIHTTPNYDSAGEYYFINGNNLAEGKILIDEKTKRISEEEFNKHKRDLYESTILLSINGTIGNIAVYNNEDVILGKSACYINLNQTKVDKTFITYFIQTDVVKNYFDLELTGSTIKNLSLKSIKETIIKVPSNPIEQQKIAYCLISLDESITAQAQKIDQLKLHKKGLMQGLFPKIIE